MQVDPRRRPRAARRRAAFDHADRLRALAAYLIAAAALAAPACAGDEPAARPSTATAPDALVADAARLLRERSTFRFTLSYTRTRADRPDDPERYAEGEGALHVTDGRGRLRFELDTGLGGTVDMPFDLRWAREWVEVAVAGESKRLPRGRARESGGLIGRLPDEPEALVRLLEAATDARAEGTETVGGEQTAVVRFFTDARKAGQSGVPAELTGLAAAGGLGRLLPMEAWIAEDGLPRLIAYEARLPPRRHRGRLILPARTVRGEYRLEGFGGQIGG